MAYGMPSGTSSTHTPPSSSTATNAGGVTGNETSVQRSLADLFNGQGSEMMDEGSMMDLFAPIIRENPDLYIEMMKQSPIYQNMLATNPQMAAYMTNPEFIREMMNPEHMEFVRRATKSMRNNDGSVNPLLGSMMSPPSHSSTHQSPSFPPYPWGFGGSAPTLRNGGMNSGMNGGMPNMSLPPQSVDELRVKYASELAQVKEMGFYDDEQVLQLLYRFGGNVNATVDYLLR